MATVAEEKQNEQDPKATIAEFAARLAEEFGVRIDEASILRLKDGTLTFVHPEELGRLMTIPLTCSKSVAGRTALTRQSEMHNNFVNVPHLDVVENLRPRGASKEISRTIQKLISVPVLGPKEVLGVLQICRKADTPWTAGPDFSARDLYRLESLAKKASQLLE
jgi:hypothetical protein